MSKENINLPKTSFSMRANLPNKEPEILKTWEKINLFKLFVFFELIFISFNFEMFISCFNSLLSDKKSIKLNDKLPESYNNLANLYLELNNYNESINCFKKW